MNKAATYRILWSSEAQKDMDELYHFYVENNPVAASNIHNAILDDVVQLQGHPK